MYSICLSFFARCIKVKYQILSLRRQFQSSLDHRDLCLILVGCVNSVWVEVQPPGQSFYHVWYAGEGKNQNPVCGTLLFFIWS